MPVVDDVEEAIAPSMTCSPPRTRSRGRWRSELADLLTDEPQSLADLARAVGREPKDGSVRNALE